MQMLRRITVIAAAAMLASTVAGVNPAAVQAASGPHRGHVRWTLLQTPAHRHPAPVFQACIHGDAGQIASLGYSIDGQDWVFRAGSFHDRCYKVVGLEQTCGQSPQYQMVTYRTNGRNRYTSEHWWLGWTCGPAASPERLNWHGRHGSGLTTVCPRGDSKTVIAKLKANARIVGLGDFSLRLQDDTTVTTWPRKVSSHRARYIFHLDRTAKVDTQNPGRSFAAGADLVFRIVQSRTIRILSYCRPAG